MLLRYHTEMMHIALSMQGSAQCVKDFIWDRSTDQLLGDRRTVGDKVV